MVKEVFYFVEKFYNPRKEYTVIKNIFILL